jgi:hypothetical protein
MGLETKKIKTNKPHRLGLLSQKKECKKPRIINIYDNHNIIHDIPSISDQVNQTITIEIEHLKSNGLMYSNILRFR